MQFLEYRLLLAHKTKSVRPVPQAIWPILRKPTYFSQVVNISLAFGHDLALSSPELSDFCRPKAETKNVKNDPWLTVKPVRKFNF